MERESGGLHKGQCLYGYNKTDTVNTTARSSDAQKKFRRFISTEIAWNARPDSNRSDSESIHQDRTTTYDVRNNNNSVPLQRSMTVTHSCVLRRVNRLASEPTRIVGRRPRPQGLIGSRKLANTGDTRFDVSQISASDNRHRYFLSPEQPRAARVGQNSTREPREIEEESLSQAVQPLAPVASVECIENRRHGLKARSRNGCCRWSFNCNIETGTPKPFGPVKLSEYPAQCTAVGGVLAVGYVPRD